MPRSTVPVSPAKSYLGAKQLTCHFQSAPKAGIALILLSSQRLSKRSSGWTEEFPICAWSWSPRCHAKPRHHPEAVPPQIGSRVDHLDPETLVLAPRACSW